MQDSSQSNNVADNNQEVFVQNPFYNNTLRNENTHPQGMNGEQVQMSSLDTGYSAIVHPKTSVTVPKQHQVNKLQHINSKEYSKLEKIPEYANPILPPLSGVYKQNCSYSNKQVLLPHPCEEPSLPRMYSKPSGDPHSTGTKVPNTYTELEQNLPVADSQGHVEIEYDDIVVQKKTHEACSRTSTTYQNPRSTHRDHSHTAVPSTVYENQRRYENQTSVCTIDSHDGVDREKHT